MSVSMFNKDLVGWKVQAAEPLHFHVSDSSGPEGYQHYKIQEGTTGTLTGEISIYYAGAEEGAAQALAQDTNRLKKLLEHPELFAPVRNALNFREAAKKLKGDEFLAATIFLNVWWDCVPKNDSVRGKFLSYIPWLRLVNAK